MPQHQLSSDMEKWAVEGIRQELEALDARKERLQQALSHLSGDPTMAPKGRIMSEDARKRISDAQKKRWALKKRTMKHAKNGSK